MGRKRAKGTLIKLSISSVFTTIGQVVSINGPGISVDQIDATILEDAWRRKISSIPDGGEVTFGVLFDPDESTLQAVTDVLGVDDQDWEIHWAGSATNKWAFKANVSGLSPAAQEGDMLRADVTLAVSQAMTLPT